MQRSTITWMVLVRDLPTTIRVADADHLAAALVLDVDTGLIRGVAAEEGEGAALRGAMKTALTQPAANLGAGNPARVLCPVGAAPMLRPVLTELGLDDVPVEEVHPGLEAEDIFDSLVGHLSGRAQPGEPPSPEDWQLLFDHALAFRRAEPWTRWSDEQHLLLTLSTDRGSEPYLAIIMGQAEVQHGLALYPGHELPASLRPGGQDEPLPESHVLLLEPAEQLPTDITARAHRYGWPAADPFSPAYMVLGPDGPEEIGRDEAHVLTVALAAVHAFDRRGLRPTTDDKPLTGSVQLADHDTVTYAIHHQREPAPPQEPSLRLHVAGSDLITPNTAVTLGHLSWDVVPELRAAAHVHRPAPADAPAPVGAEVPLLVLSPEVEHGPALAAALAELDPYGASGVDIGDGQQAVVIVGGNAAEVALALPDKHPALLAFRRRLRQTRGRHLIMVADLDSATGEGNIYGLFECHQPVTPRAPERRTASNGNNTKRR